MNVEIWTETPLFLFWEYLFRNFGIFSLLCTHSHLDLISISTFLPFSDFYLQYLYCISYVPENNQYIETKVTFYEFCTVSHLFPSGFATAGSGVQYTVLVVLKLRGMDRTEGT
jgi:hypothetical protein